MSKKEDLRQQIFQSLLENIQDAKSLGEAYETISRTIGNLFDFLEVYAANYVRETKTLTFVSSFGIQAHALSAEAAIIETMMAKVANTAAPLLVHDFPQPAELKTFLGVPVILRGKVFGVLGLSSRNASFPTEADIPFFTQVALFAASLMDRKKVEVDLRNSTERLNATLNALPDLLFITDKEGRISEFRAPNPKKLFLSPSIFFGKKTEEILPPEPARIIKKALAEAAEKGFHKGAVYCLPMPEGISCFELSISVMGDLKSPEAKFIVLARDITERRLDEDRLRESEAKYRALHEGMMDGYAQTDLAGHLTDCNEAYRQMLGYDRTELIGKHFNEFTPKNWHIAEQEILEKEVFTKGYSALYEKEYIRKDGTVFPVELRTSYLRDNHLKPTGFWAIVRDISERKRHQQESDRANKAKDIFLSVLSHELRTPLTTILTWSQLLQSGRLDPEKSKKGLKMIEESVRIQGQLIDDLLDISRIISGKLVVDIANVKPETIINSVLESLEREAAAGQVRITREIDQTVEGVKADPVRLKQILWNLIGNAIKFTPSNDARLEIHLKREGDQAKFIIKDNGIGIDHDQLPNIFQYFFQADSSSTRRHGGLGLGLAISQSLARLMGGSLTGESAGKNKGSTFTLSLPLADTTSRGLEKTNTERQVQENDLTRIKGIKTLLVDDQPSTLEALSLLLKSFGLNVTTASSVREALQEFEKQQPDLLLSDIAMPGEDGYSLIKKIRGRSPEQGGNIPAIAVTAYAAIADRNRALASGFQGYIAKPVDSQELIQIILKVL